MQSELTALTNLGAKKGVPSISISISTQIIQHPTPLSSLQNIPEIHKSNTAISLQ